MPDHNNAQTIAMLAQQRDMNLRNHDAPSVITMPSDHQVVDTEEYQLHRNRFRGEFKTQSSHAFADYVKDRDGADKVFINNTNTSRMSCRAIFNLGDEVTPGHADDTANLELPVTDEFSALLGLERISQQSLIDFVQDYAYCLKFYDQDDDAVSEMPFAQALRAFRSLTVKTASEMTSERGDLNSTKSALERIEADSKYRLPRFIMMSTSLYEDLPKVEVNARVAVITNNDNLGFSIRIVAKQKELNDAADRFVDLMKNLLPQETPVYVGVFNPDV